jgi:hypothetical protein
MNAKHECLSDALCAAQAEFPAIVKEKVANTGKYAYAYADIADVIAAVTPVLAKHGLCQLQRMAVQNGQQLLVSELRHKAESVASEMLLPIEGVDPQSVGKVITYYRRYALQALLGVAAEKDDDAADMGDVRQPTAAPQHQAPPRQPPDFVQRRPQAAHPSREDVGEARYNIEGYEVSPKGWIEDARRASHARQGQALLEWWAGYRQTREMIYRRHEAHRDALAELSAEIKERATAAQAPREPADILRAG